MNIELRERLRNKTAEASARQRQTGASADTTATEPEAGPGQVGHVYVLEESAGHPVEWAILEVTSLRQRLAVPLDDQPLVGSTDIAVSSNSHPAPGLRAPSVLRCAYALDLDHRMLATDHQTGHVPEATVGQALDLCRQLSERENGVAGDRLGTAIGLEVETEPEYRRWIEEVVIPARDTVRQAVKAQTFASSQESASSATSEPATSEISSGSPGPDPIKTRRRSTPRRHAERRGARLWALAVAALLALSLGLGWQLLSFQEERAAYLAEIEAARAPAAELRRQNEELKERLEDVEGDRDELRERLGSTETVTQGAIEALINVPLAVLISGVRGEPEVVEVAADAEWVALAIELESGRSDPSYRLELRTFQGGQTVLRRRGLEQSRGLLSVLLPAELLPPAAYRLDLAAEDGGHAMNFTLIVERP